MNTTPAQITRFAMTTIVVIIALAVIYLLWEHFKVEPWTRDGRVNGNVVQVAPDVSGLVTQVMVHDNQTVKAGDVLFTIDQARYSLAVEQAKEAINSARTQLDQAEREVRRNATLKDLVSAEQSEQSIAKRDQLQVSLAQANSALEGAKLNLDRATVKAAVNGRVTNLELRAGSYAVTGKPVLALIDLQSINIIGYFEETKIDHIHIGDRVRVHLMGSHQQIDGHVDSIAGGIEDRELTASPNLLANVNPTFNWVRLAQRIPVRVQLDKVPDGTELILGRTASVEVLPHRADQTQQATTTSTQSASIPAAPQAQATTQTVTQTTHTTSVGAS